jgi:hypothetical protein
MERLFEIINLTFVRIPLIKQFKTILEITI